MRKQLWPHLELTRPASRTRRQRDSCPAATWVTMLGRPKLTRLEYI